MNIFKFSVGSEAKRVAVRCVFAIGVVCWANWVFSVVCNLFFVDRESANPIRRLQILTHGNQLCRMSRVFGM